MGEGEERRSEDRKSIEEARERGLNTKRDSESRGGGG